MMKRIAIVVPAFNEEKSLPEVLSKIEKACPNYDIIVVNDGSTDKTLETVRKIAEKNHRIILLSHPINLGGCASVQTASRLAYLEGYDFIVQVDADGQHDPSEVCKLLESLYNDEADLVIGSRFLEKGSNKVPLIRRLGINFYSKLASMIAKQRITDVNSGFRAMNRDVIAYVAEKYLPRHATFEATTTLGKRGYKIKEIPVMMKPRRHGKSEFSIKRLALYPFKMIISLIRVL